MESVEERVGKACSRGGDELRALLRDPSPKVVAALLSNAALTDEDLLVLARRRDLSGELLGGLAGRKFKADGYNIKLALVQNPKTPRRVALSLVRGLKLPDMAVATRNKTIPTELRQLAEGLIKEKLPVFPLGVKTTIARLVSEDLLKVMLLEDNGPLTRACFDNPMMRESVLLWAINHVNTPASVIEYIAMSPRWSAPYTVRYALIRNEKTPVGRASALARTLKAQDQRLLYNDPRVPATVKVWLEMELEAKEQPLGPPAAEGRVVRIIEDVGENT